MLGRKLDRHVLFSFLGPFVASLAGLAVLMVVFDLFDRIDECFRLLVNKQVGTGPALRTIGTYYAGRVLAFVAGYGGLACLAGGALTVAVLHRSRELTAMRAAGVSMRRSLTPLLVFAVLAGAAQLAVAEYAVRPLAPAAEEALDVIYRRKTQRGRNIGISHQARLAVWTRNGDGGKWVAWRTRGHVCLVAGQISNEGRTIERLAVEILLPEPAEPGGAFVYYVTARRAEWKRGRWVLTAGKFFRDWGRDEQYGVPCSGLTAGVTPAGLEARSLGLPGMALPDLFELRNDQSARVELWQRLSLPLLNLILLLVGLPLAVMGSARGGRLLPLGLALVLGAVYVLIGELGAHVARGAMLFDYLRRFAGSPWMSAVGGPMRLSVDLAVGLPHLVFLIVGVTLYWRMDR
jgi:lipopolysaccharide export LptBFGC system permease protein LptF